MTQVPPDQHRKAVMMLVLATVFWGLSFPTIKAVEMLNSQLLPGVSSWFSASYALAPRMIIAALVFAAWQIRKGWSVTRKELVQGGVIGLFAGAGMILQNDALHYTAASTSAFLTQFYAIIIPVYIAIKARRAPGWRIWVCALLVLAGSAILGGVDWRHLYLGRGEFETILCSVFFTGQILWLEKKEYADNRPGQLSFVMFVVQGVIFSVMAVLTAPSGAALLVPWTSPGWLGLIVILAVFSTLFAYGLMNRWQPKITATEAGLIYCVEPIFGSVMALFLPGMFSALLGISYENETATWTLLVGGGLVTLANVLIQLKPPVRDIPAT